MAIHQYRGLGMMSGSSLDGIDLAFCFLELEAAGAQARVNEWRIDASACIPYPDSWRQLLVSLPGLNAREFALAHAGLGRYMGKCALDFLSRHQLQPDFIAAHGHTVFHFPEEGLSFQAGDGAAIAAVSGYPTIDNFRMADVSFGGQGAPLAPLADQLLFPDYHFLLNLGGIANLSCRCQRGYVAFDCTGANQLLNRLARETGRTYDPEGQLAACGSLLPALLEQAARLPYYQRSYPKSLGNDWVENQLIPIFSNGQIDINSRLHTACVHIAQRIAQGVADARQKEEMGAGPFSMMVTGGGAFNRFLVDCIQKECEKICSLVIEIPRQEVVEYKEALLMALLGALRAVNLPNCLPATTGASRAAIGGALHQGWKRML